MSPSSLPSRAPSLLPSRSPSLIADVTTSPSLGKSEVDNAERNEVQVSRWNTQIQFSVAILSDCTVMTHEDAKNLVISALNDVILDIVSDSMRNGMFLDVEGGIHARARTSKRQIQMKYDPSCSEIYIKQKNYVLIWQALSICFEVHSTNGTSDIHALFDQSMKLAIHTTINDGRLSSFTKSLYPKILAVVQTGNEKNITVVEFPSEKEDHPSEEVQTNQKKSSDILSSKNLLAGWILLGSSTICGTILMTYIHVKRKKKLKNAWMITSFPQISMLPPGDSSDAPTVQFIEGELGSKGGETALETNSGSSYKSVHGF